MEEGDEIRIDVNMNYTYIIIYTHALRNYICIQFYLYIKRYTGILTALNCDIHIYYIQIESLIFARKSISEKEKRTRKYSLIHSHVVRRRKARCRSRSALFIVPRSCISSWHGIACSFVATIKRALQRLSYFNREKSLRLSFVLDALRKLTFRGFFWRDRISSEKYLTSRKKILWF